MPFDPTKDEVLWSKQVEIPGGVLEVKVCSYNGGTPKVQIGRMRGDPNDELKFAKLGRLTVEEIKGILPHLQTAADECAKAGGGAA